MDTIQRISPAALANSLRPLLEKQLSNAHTNGREDCLYSDLSVIDVREDDYDENGHIRSAINLPSGDYFQDDEQVNELVQHYKNKKMVVFHCTFSQVRGPFCAQRFASRMDVMLQEQEARPEVRVLAGGFKSFQAVQTVLSIFLNPLPFVAYTIV
uniref:protein-tyrosine-phosphatase n=1 Tax=Albugo laibachii Nc14 TaxID=890382 RepID=F0WRZ8_9STRA|nr:conserved hypothetical protein [Albugo laibachii Nc14]|eukprot:CCA24115.1 conserved hypothetical protein [Albugo laibachii Nc14]